MTSAQQLSEISCETGRNQIMHHLVSHCWTLDLGGDMVEYLTRVESKGIIRFFFFF